MIDLQGIVGLAGIERDVIASGVFDGARCYVFATSWAAPVVDEEPLIARSSAKRRYPTTAM